MTNQNPNPLVPRKAARQAVREPLQRSIAVMLADSFGHGDLHSTPWTMPATLPALEEIQAAVDHLEWKMIGAGDEGVGVIVKLLIESGLAMEKDDPVNWDTKHAIYSAALDDIPADLLEAAFLRCVKESAFFPQVAVFRKFIEREFTERARMLDRARRIRDAILNPEKANGKKFVPEESHVRVAGMVASFTRNNMPERAKVAAVELYRLAEEERAKPEPAAWITEGVDVTLAKRTDKGKWEDEVVRVFVQDFAADLEPEAVAPALATVPTPVPGSAVDPKDKAPPLDW